MRLAVLDTQQTFVVTFAVIVGLYPTIQIVGLQEYPLFSDGLTLDCRVKPG